ncbi:unnamed protein product [marine sediment metagenome]|uniref:Uncharacterized protein n=1 Tax=marine sediment metagenome TaxID=412755 RepID=X1BZ74_9ZZZZ
MSRRSRPKGAWVEHPEPLDPFDPDHEAEVTWKQIYAKVDEILADPKSRRHKFPGSPEKAEVTETVEILPHGARRIRVHWPE